MGTKTKNTTTSDSTKTVAPPNWTMPGIQTVADQVSAAAKTPAPAYTGGFVAPINNQPAVDAYHTAAGAAPGYADYTDNVMKSWQATQPSFQMQNLPSFSAWQAPTNDAQMHDAIGGEAGAVTRQLLQQVLPALRSSAMDAGAYSGDRASAIMPQLAMDDATRNIAEIASKYVYQNANDNANRGLTAWNAGNDRLLQSYQADTQRGLGAGQLQGDQNLQFMQQLPALIDTAMRMRTSVGDINSQAATLEQQQQQQQINDALQRHQYEVMKPYEGLDIATQLLTQLSGNYGTTTGHDVQTQVQQTSGMGPILQAALGAAGMAFGMPMGGGSTLGGSLFGAKPPVAAAVGGSPTRNIFPG